MLRYQNNDATKSKHAIIKSRVQFMSGYGRESVIPPGPPTHKMLFSCRQTFRCYLYSSIAQKVPLSPDLLPMLVWHVDHALT